MKKQILLASLFFLTLSTLAEAQVRFGAKAGANITNVTKVNGISKSRTSFNIGALALIPIDNNDQFYFQPEVLYSGEGEYLGGRQGMEEYKNYLNFIKVPLLIKAYLSEADSEFFAAAGPYLGFKIGDKIDVYEHAAANQKFNSFDLGVSLGGGYSINRQFEIEARYSFGLTDMVENDWENANNHNSVLSFGVSYILR